MYFEQAIERLNKIDWKNIGKERWAHENDDSLYGFEFLKRMAHFFKKHHVENVKLLPFLIDITLYLEKGTIALENVFEEDVEKVVMEKCNDDFKQAFGAFPLLMRIPACYLKLAMLSDEKEEYSMYLDVYEPLIQLFESGGGFRYCESGMSFFNSGLITPIHNWYEKWADYNSIFICEEEIDDAAYIYLEKVENKGVTFYSISFGVHSYFSHSVRADKKEQAQEIYEGIKADLKTYVNSATLDDRKIWQEPFVSQWYNR